jgi:hypothetical protein
LNDLNSILNIFNKITIQKIGEYLSMFVDLYIKPVKSWKRIINVRKTSIDYFIIYILFFGILVFIITWDFRIVIKYVFVNLLITVIPFAFLLIPYVIFSRLWKKHLKFNRLYRLFFVFYIQIFPFVHFPIILAQWAYVEAPYIFASNLTVLFDLLLILVVPLILKLKFKQKLIWIICNYIFVSFYLISMNKILDVSSDFRIILNKVEYLSPKAEFEEILSNYKRSDVYIVENSIYLWSKKENDRFNINAQYCTLFTSDYVIESINKRLNKISSFTHLDFLDPNILNSKNPFTIYNEIFNQYKKDSTSLKFAFNPISNTEKTKMDSLWNSFNEIFYSDLKLMDSLKNHAKFESNRKYADYIFNYLKQYDSIATDSISIRKLTIDGPVNFIEFENSLDLLTYSLDNSYINYPLQGIVDRNIDYSEKYEKSDIVRDVLYYPLFKLLNYDRPTFDYRDQLENINFKKKSINKK